MTSRKTVVPVLASPGNVAIDSSGSPPGKRSRRDRDPRKKVERSDKRQKLDAEPSTPTPIPSTTIPTIDVSLPLQPTSRALPPSSAASLNMSGTGRALPLVTFVQCDHGEEMRWHNETIETLRLKEFDEVVAVTIAGKLRCGKSYILCKLVEARQGTGFSVQSTTKPCTKGIWVWSEPKVYSSPTGKRVAVLFLDSEGSSAVDISDAHDKNIQTIIWNLSSMILYNSMRTIDEASVTDLALICTMAKKLSHAALAKPDEAKLLALDTPDLIWILRDSDGLQAVDEDNKEITATEFMENSLRIEKKQKTPSSSPGTLTDGQKNREIILNTFSRKRWCIRLVTPATTEQLRQYPEKGDKDFNPVFFQELETLKEYIRQNGIPRTFLGKSMNGWTWNTQGQLYVEALNQNKIPAIENHTQTIIRLTQAHAHEKAQREWQQFEFTLKGTRLCTSPSLFQRGIQQVKRVVVDKFKQNLWEKDSRDAEHQVRSFALGMKTSMQDLIETNLVQLSQQLEHSFQSMLPQDCANYSQFIEHEKEFLVKTLGPKLLSDGETIFNKMTNGKFNESLLGDPLTAWDEKTQALWFKVREPMIPMIFQRQVSLLEKANKVLEKSSHEQELRIHELEDHKLQDKERWARLTEELHKTQAEKISLAASKSDLETNNSILKHDVEKLQEQLVQAERNNKHLAEEAAEKNYITDQILILQTEKQSLERETEIRQSELEDKRLRYEEEQLKLQETITELQVKLKSRERLFTQMLNLKNKLYQQTQEWESKYDTLKKELEEKAKQCEQFNADKKTFEGQLREKHEDSHKWENRFMQQKQLTTAKETSLAEKSKEIDALKQVISTQESLKRIHENLIIEHTSLKKQLDRCKDNLADYQAQRDRYKKALDVSQHENATLKAEVRKQTRITPTPIETREYSEAELLQSKSLHDFRY